MRFSLLVITLLLGSPLAAQCIGQDVRPSLSLTDTEELAAAIAAEPNATGNFWRATRGDQAITLVGTVHLDDPRLDPIAATLSDDVGDADVVFLEMTKREQAMLQNQLASDPSMTLLAEGTLDTLLPPDRWDALSQAATARGIPAQVTARMQPWYLSLLLALPVCVLQQGTPEGLDAKVEALAEAAGVPTQALEPHDTLFTLFAEEPMETQIDFLSASIVDERASEDMLATTLNTYFEQAPAELWHLSRITASQTTQMDKAALDGLFEDMAESLLTERNRDWVDLLSTRPEDTILAAFGAAHLFGQDGVVELLRGKGYDVVRFMP